MNTQELATKYKELGAEIERLKQQPEGVWEPKENEQYWRINSFGTPTTTRHCGNLARANHNVYETESLARKASVLQRRSNLVIQACLNFDPDFVPDWENLCQSKFGVEYSHYAKRWNSNTVSPSFVNILNVAHVSTLEIAEKVAEYLNSQEIK